MSAHKLRQDWIDAAKEDGRTSAIAARTYPHAAKFMTDRLDYLRSRWAGLVEQGTLITADIDTLAVAWWAGIDGARGDA